MSIFIKTTTTTGVTAAPNPAVFGQPVTLTATVTSMAMGVIPTGTVTFTSGGATLGTATLTTGVATLPNIALPVGANQTITATYNGDTNFTGSSGTTTITVNAVILVVTGATGTGSGNTGSATLPVIRSGATLTLSAQLPNGTPATGVTYTSGNTGVLGVNPTTGVVTGFAGGTVTITVTAANGATGSITITVTPATGSGLAYLAV